MVDQTTLAQKVYSILCADNFDNGLSRLPGVRLGAFERDLREWGMVYGIAFGIARTEDLWEPVDSVAGRASEAAVEAFKRWSGEFTKRHDTISPLVDDVLRAFHDSPDDLHDAIIGLGNAIGWPGAEVGAVA